MERVDFSELVTEAARRMLPALLARSQSFSFDYRGPRVTVPVDVSRLKRTVHRLLYGAADCMQSGFVMFLAEAEIHGSSCELTITAAGAGELAVRGAIHEVLLRLELHAVAHPSTVAGAIAAVGRCPVTGAAVEFSALPGEGVMCRGTLQSTAFEILDDVVEPAHPMTHPIARPRAWLINERDAAAHSLSRRLQRLGWTVSLFDSCAHVQMYLAELAPGARRPSLVVASEFDGAAEESVQHLQSLLPPSTKIVYAVASGSAMLRHADAMPGCEVRVCPFSPADLLAFTRATRGQAAGAPWSVSTLSSLQATRPLVLVVDDDELNRVVACGLLEALGYETATAADGLAAIDRCRLLAPSAVLMDVDMPGLDGLQTTAELRKLQKVGEVAPFAIVAATADTGNSRKAICLSVGMDGYLSKPLALASLKEELRRVTLLSSPMAA